MSTAIPPIPQDRPYPSFFTRLRYRARLLFIKTLISVYSFASRFRRLPAGQKPSYTKTYPVLPSLINHIFIPESYKPGSAPLPLLIDVHGGGFAIGHPFIDDPDNAFLSSRGICVVSINYRKGPEHPFPGPVHDVANLIEAVLDDPSLPVDKTRVALIGYSAGGNLVLTATQLKGLQKRIKGVVAYYPAADPGRTFEQRMKTATKLPERRSDILKDMAPMFDWAYVSRGTDRTNPLLSPVRAPRNIEPEKLYILGCEYDMLCTEAEEMAEIWADSEGGQQEALPGERVGWKRGNITWEKLLGLEHGYNQRSRMEKDPETKALWEQRTKEVHKVVVEWLFKEVYA